MPGKFHVTSKSVYSDFPEVSGFRAKDCPHFLSRRSRSAALRHKSLNLCKPYATTPRPPHTGRRCGDNVIADLNATTGDVVRTYVTPTLDGNVSMTIHDGGAESTYYYNQDERSSVMNLTDGTGTVAATYAYSAYGDPIDRLRSQVSALSLQNRYTYTGRESSDV